MEQIDPASLTGTSESEVCSQLGSPSAADEFVLDGNLREFSIELFNHFTPKEVTAANISNPGAHLYKGRSAGDDSLA